MNITSYVEESPTKKSMSLEIPLEEVRQATEKAARTLARQIRLPGFRPGKVPARRCRSRGCAARRGQRAQRTMAPCSAPEISPAKRSAVVASAIHAG